MPNSGGDAPRPPSDEQDADERVGLDRSGEDAIDVGPLPRGPLRYLELDWRTVLVVLGVFSALTLIYSTVRTLSSSFTAILVAAFLALAANPLVAWLQRRLHLQRALAIAAGLLIVTAAVVAVTLLFGGQTVQAAEQLQDQLPNTLQQMTSLPIVGQTLAENQVPSKVQEWLSDLPAQLGSNDSAIAQFVGSVSQGVGYFILTITLAIMLLLDGPVLARRAGQMIPIENQQRATRVGKIVYDVIARYFAGSILLGVLFGVWVLITGLILNVPLTPLLAAWAGITALLPQIGGALGGVVVVAVSLTAPGGIITALIMGGLFVAYMTFSNNVLLPVLVGRAINVTPPTTMLAAIGGFAVGGIIGALFAMPVVGAIKAVYLDIQSDEKQADEQIEQGRKRRRLGLVAMVKRRRRRAEPAPR